MKFSFITINVNNLDESIAFYQDILGMELARRFQAGPNEIAFMGKGEVQIELICGAGGAQVSHGENWNLGFSVPSLDAAMKEMEEKGIAIHSGPFQPGPGVKFFFILDPNGVKIELIEQH